MSGRARNFGPRYAGKRYPSLLADIEQGKASVAALRSWATTEVEDDGLREVVDALATAIDRLKQSPAIEVKGASGLRRQIAELRAQVRVRESQMADEPGRRDFEDLLELLGIDEREYRLFGGTPSEFRSRLRRQ